MKSQERQKKLVRLHEWCMALSSLILEGASGPATADDEALRHGLDLAFRSGDLRALEAAARDLREWASGLSAANRTRIDSALRAGFGRGLAEEAEDLAGAARAVWKRGRVASEEECRLLEARAQQLARDSEHADELAGIARLLETYFKAR